MNVLRKRLYWIWSDMRSRCHNPNHKYFKNYGGRGISVCDNWEIFSNFENDMGTRPEGKSLDRIDNDLNYCPENCKWSTRKDQNSNRRNCIYIQDLDEKITLKEYCRRKDISYRPIVKRIQDRGWPIQLALETPVGCKTNFMFNFRKAA